VELPQGERGELPMRSDDNCKYCVSYLGPSIRVRGETKGHLGPWRRAHLFQNLSKKGKSKKESNTTATKKS